MLVEELHNPPAVSQDAVVVVGELHTPLATTRPQ
jgi:hypothetical protein